VCWPSSFPELRGIGDGYEQRCYFSIMAEP
jgi:hypothetical protein